MKEKTALGEQLFGISGELENLSYLAGSLSESFESKSIRGAVDSLSWYLERISDDVGRISGEVEALEQKGEKPCETLKKQLPIMTG